MCDEISRRMYHSFETYDGNNRHKKALVQNQSFLEF